MFFTIENSTSTKQLADLFVTFFLYVSVQRPIRELVYFSTTLMPCSTRVRDDQGFRDIEKNLVISPCSVIIDPVQ